MACITFLHWLSFWLYKAVLHFGELYSITYFLMQFEIMYPRLIICYFIHKYFLITSWKTFWQFVRRPNMRACLLLIEQMCGPPSAIFLHFQNISSKTQCKCFWNSNQVRNLLRSLSCVCFTKFYLSFNNLWTTCRFRSTIFRSTCNRPYALTKFPNPSANCEKMTYIYYHKPYICQHKCPLNLCWGLISFAFSTLLPTILPNRLWVGFVQK